MTIAEIATRLNVSRPYVRRLIAEGHPRARSDLGIEPVIDRSEAEKYIRAAKARQHVAMEAYMRASQSEVRTNGPRGGWRPMRIAA